MPSRMHNPVTQAMIGTRDSGRNKQQNNINNTNNTNNQGAAWCSRCVGSSCHPPFIITLVIGYNWCSLLGWRYLRCNQTYIYCCINNLRFILVNTNSIVQFYFHHWISVSKTCAIFITMSLLLPSPLLQGTCGLIFIFLCNVLLIVVPPFVVLFLLANILSLYYLKLRLLTILWYPQTPLQRNDGKPSSIIVVSYICGNVCCIFKMELISTDLNTIFART